MAQQKIIKASTLMEAMDVEPARQGTAVAASIPVPPPRFAREEAKQPREYAKRRPGDKQLFASIPPDLYDALDSFCFLSRPKIAKRDAIIEAIKDYLEKHQQTM